MHSNIVDERGVTRVQVSYKAAFYDRWARFSIVDSVGGNLANLTIQEVGYGKSSQTLPVQWSLLTESEKADFVIKVKTDLAIHEDYLKTHVDEYSSRDVAACKKILEAVALTEKV